MLPGVGFAARRDGKVYLGDQDGDVAVLSAGREMKKISEIDMAMRSRDARAATGYCTS